MRLIAGLHRQVQAPKKLSNDAKPVAHPPPLSTEKPEHLNRQALLYSYAAAIRKSPPKNDSEPLRLEWISLPELRDLQG